MEEPQIVVQIVLKPLETNILIDLFADAHMIHLQIDLFDPLLDLNIVKIVAILHYLLLWNLIFNLG